MATELNVNIMNYTKKQIEELEFLLKISTEALKLECRKNNPSDEYINKLIVFIADKKQSLEYQRKDLAETQKRFMQGETEAVLPFQGGAK